MRGGGAGAVLVAGLDCELVVEGRVCALGLFAPPQPLITTQSRKKLALGDLKECRNAVDKCRKDVRSNGNERQIFTDEAR
jgi:hypothetical protein